MESCCHQPEIQIPNVVDNDLIILFKNIVTSISIGSQEKTSELSSNAHRFMASIKLIFISILQDADRLLNNSYPEFTDCFQNTLLVWVPCGLVWLILPLYLRFLLTREDAPLPLSFRNVAKTVST